MLTSKAMNGENSPATVARTFLMLPNDLVLNCLARVSRLHYTTLSLVSKRLRSLLASLELYQTRTLLGSSEICLYMCLKLRPDYERTWFTLQISHPNPNPGWSTPCFAPYTFLKTKTKLSENFSVSMQTTGSPYVGRFGIVTVGYNIYKIGVHIKGLPSSKVIFMDCRSHTWHEAPSMRMARDYPIVNVLNGKIYVAGGNKDCDSSNWIEFFDPKTQVWEYVQSPGPEICEGHLLESIFIDGKLYLFGNKNVVYTPKENRWDEVEYKEMRLALCPYHNCVIDNILYGFGWSEKLEWYDFEARSWRVVKGLEKLPKLPKKIDFNRLVDYDGNIMILWKDARKNKKIWCAEISLERCNGQEIHGKIEWCNVVLTVSNSCEFVQVLAVTV